LSVVSLLQTRGGAGAAGGGAAPPGGRAAQAARAAAADAGGRRADQGGQVGALEPAGRHADLQREQPGRHPADAAPGEGSGECPSHGLGWTRVESLARYVAVKHGIPIPQHVQHGSSFFFLKLSSKEYEI